MAILVALAIILIGRFSGDLAVPTPPATDGSGHRFEPLPDLGTYPRGGQAEPAIGIESRPQSSPAEADGVVLVLAGTRGGFDAGRLRLCWAENWGDGPQWDVLPVSWEHGVRYFFPAAAWGKVCLIDLPDSEFVYPLPTGVLISANGRLAHVEEGGALPEGAMPPSPRRTAETGRQLATGKLARAVNGVELGKAGTPDGIPIERHGEIRVQAVDPGDRPLGDCAIQWLGTWGEPALGGADRSSRRSVSTDTTGMALLRRCRPGTHRIEAFKAGYTQAQRDLPVTVRAGERTIDVQVVMEPGFELRGTVVNERGEPVEHGSVRVLVRDQGGRLRTIHGTLHITDDVATDQHGAFRITNNSPLAEVRRWLDETGPLVLYASDQVGQTATHEVTDVHSLQYIRLSTEVAREFRISVTDPDGAVLKGATLKVKGMSQPGGETRGPSFGTARFERQFAADDSGLITVRLPTSTCSAHVRLSGWVHEHGLVLISQADLKSPEALRVVLKPAGSLRVTCPAGWEDAVLLAARILEDGSREWHEAPVQTVNGRAELRDVLPGDWLVGVRSSLGELSQAEYVEIEAGETHELALHRPTGPPVHATGPDWNTCSGGAVLPWFGKAIKVVSQLSAEAHARRTHRLWDKPSDSKLEFSLMRVVDGGAPLVPPSWPSWGLVVFSLEDPAVVLPGQPYVAVPWPDARKGHPTGDAVRRIPLTIAVDAGVEAVPEFVHFLTIDGHERTLFSVFALDGRRTFSAGSITVPRSSPIPRISAYLTSSQGTSPRPSFRERPVATAEQTEASVVIRIHDDK